MIKMRKRIILSLIIILSLTSISVVCANENATDLEIADDVDSIMVDEVDDSSNVDDSPVNDDSSNDGGNSSVVDDNPTVVQNSTISASNVVGYETFSTKFVAELTADGQPLVGKNVNITLNDVLYKRITDAKGQVTLSV